MKALALSLTVLLGACAGAPRAGVRAPELAGTDLTGAPARLADFRGRVVLVDFWATWCEPCKDSLPLYERLYQSRRGDGLTVVGISQDALGVDVAAFSRSKGVTYPQWRDGDRAAYRAFGVYQLPAAFLIGRDGTVLRRWDGFVPVDAAAIERAVDEALARK